VSPITSPHLVYTAVLAMRVSIISAVIALTAGFASAAPIQPKDVQNRDAEPQFYDVSYIDKAKREETDKKREAQFYGKLTSHKYVDPKTMLMSKIDISYIDKRTEEEKRKSDPQFYDVSYIDKRTEEEKRKSDPQFYDISYVDKRDEEKKRKSDPQFYDISYIDKRE
jgi:uncharacterized protein (DUF849 family)